MSEKRRRARVPVDIYVNKYVGGVPHLARVRDLSPEGLGLARVLEPRLDGRRVGLQFQLPGSDEVIYAEGEVVRDGSARGAAEASGVRFTLLTERHRRLIDAWVGRQAPRAH